MKTLEKSFLNINLINDKTNEKIFLGNIIHNEETGYFEGLSDDQESYVFGKLERPKSITIYVMHGEYISRYNLRKGVDCYYYGNDLINDNHYKMVIASRNRDPRDMNYQDRDDFISMLNNYKNSTLSEEGISIIDYKKKNIK